MSRFDQNLLALLFVGLAFALSGVANITKALELSGISFYWSGAVFCIAVALVLIFKKPME